MNLIRILNLLIIKRKERKGNNLLGGLIIKIIMIMI
jgi:hypothetical protein